VIRTYSELEKIETFVGRFRYAMLEGSVGIATFGFDRHLNQDFYASPDWKRARRQAIIRDNGCDLGHPDYPIADRILVHHMNPLTPDHILERDEDKLYNLDYLVCVSARTHNAIHFSDERQLPEPYVERRPNDTTLW